MTAIPVRAQMAAPINRSQRRRWSINIMQRAFERGDAFEPLVGIGAMLRSHDLYTGRQRPDECRKVAAAPPCYARAARSDCVCVDWEIGRDQSIRRDSDGVDVRRRPYQQAIEQLGRSVEQPCGHRRDADIVL